MEGQAIWDEDAVRTFGEQFNSLFDFPVTNNMYSADFEEKKKAEELRRSVRNSLIEIKVLNGIAVVPSNLFSEPLLTHEQRYVIGAAQDMWSRYDSEVPIMTCTWPFMIDYTSEEVEKIMRAVSGIASTDPMAVSHESRQTREGLKLTQAEVKKILEETKAAGERLFSRRTAFTAGSEFVRVFRGRKFFETSLPSYIMRFEIIPTTRTKGVSEEMRGAQRINSPLQFQQSRTMDVRLGLYITKLVEERRRKKSNPANAFLAPQLYVSKLCKSGGDMFGVLVNDAWSGNVSSLIRSYDRNDWKIAMKMVKTIMAPQIKEKLHILNHELHIQHGDLKVDNLVYLKVGDELTFGFIDFGVSALYLKSEKYGGGDIFIRTYRNSLFDNNTGPYLDAFLDASYLQYSLRFAFYEHFARDGTNTEFFKKFKTWYPFVPSPMDYIRRLIMYAGTEHSRAAWAYQDEEYNARAMKIMNLPGNEHDFTANEITIAAQQISEGQKYGKEQEEEPVDIEVLDEAGEVFDVEKLKRETDRNDKNLFIFNS